MHLSNWPRALCAGALMTLASAAVSSCGTPAPPSIPTVATSPPAVEGVEPAPADEGETVEVQRMTIEIFDDYIGAAIASVEERIFLSDVIVRAALVSAADGVLRFRAVEYLKGAGADEFSVSASTDGRDTQWDDREAVLFLALLASGSSADSAGGTPSEFEFADTTAFDYEGFGAPGAVSYSGDLPEGYAVDSRNPVWLPSGSASDQEAGASASRLMTASASVSSDAWPTVSLADLRSKIAWVEGGDGVEGYDECIRASLENMRFFRDWEAYHGRTFLLTWYESRIASGAGRGEVVHLYGGTEGEAGYDRVWVTGQDAGLFTAQIVDDDEDPTNGFMDSVATARPLPAGTYRVISRGQDHWYEPCGYTTQFNRLGFAVTVTAPAGTVHEALFDPAELSPGIGFSPTAGTLTPAGFSVGGAATSIAGLKWERGAIVLALDPGVPLDGHSLEIIALDGAIVLSLPASSAAQDGSAGTLTWTAADRPWEVGDRLMLRIRALR